MTSIWFPGRVPLCSIEIISLLTQYIEILVWMAETRDANYFESLTRINQAVQKKLHQESTECLHSDPLIIKLKELVTTTTTAAYVLYQNKAWENLIELSLDVMAVRNELGEQTAKVIA